MHLLTADTCFVVAERWLIRHSFHRELVQTVIAVTIDTIAIRVHNGKRIGVLKLLEAPFIRVVCIL